MNFQFTKRRHTGTRRGEKRPPVGARELCDTPAGRVWRDMPTTAHTIALLF